MNDEEIRDQIMRHGASVVASLPNFAELINYRLNGEDSPSETHVRLLSALGSHKALEILDLAALLVGGVISAMNEQCAVRCDWPNDENMTVPKIAVDRAQQIAAESTREALKEWGEQG